MTQEKQIYIFGLGVVTIWDAFTTITGTADILGNTTTAYILGVIFALILTSILIKTYPILYNPKEDLLHISAKILWGFAFIYDIATSFMGNKALVDSADSIFGFAQFMVTAGLAIFVSSSPVVISYFLYNADD